MFEKVIENVRSKSPLVHSITNYVTVNDCANILLASGASPIMADDIGEVAEITSICNALVINIGTLNARTIEAMIAAGKRANELGHPIILDPVGAGASALRTQTTFDLLKEVRFSVIRGNISEIKTVEAGVGTTKGVDADGSDAVSEENMADTIAFTRSLSEQTGAVIAITGAIDIVTDTERTYIIKNGHPQMSKVTGTGCMLSCVVAGYVAANQGRTLEATAAAVSAMGLCGELAYQQVTKIDGGTGTYRTLLIDYMSKMDDKILSGGQKVEIR